MSAKNTTEPDWNGWLEDPLKEPAAPVPIVVAASRENPSDQGWTTRFGFAVVIFIVCMIIFTIFTPPFARQESADGFFRSNSVGSKAFVLSASVSAVFLFAPSVQSWLC